MDYQVGDIVKLKKPHPCGSYEWEILRVGADFRLKCTGCGHQIMVARKSKRKRQEEKEKNLLRSVKKYRLRKNLRRYFLVNSAEL